MVNEQDIAVERYFLCQSILAIIRSVDECVVEKETAEDRFNNPPKFASTTVFIIGSFARPKFDIFFVFTNLISYIIPNRNRVSNTYNYHMPEPFELIKDSVFFFHDFVLSSLHSI